MATMVTGTGVCDLPDWVPVPTNDSTISIINLVVAGSNMPFGIFAFLSNLAIIITALKTPSLQRPSNILLCSLATSDCLVGLVAQPLFFTWWMLLQRAQDYSCFYLKLLTIVSWLSRMFPTVLSLFYMAVISLDRCYALCRPLFYRANVTKQGNASFCLWLVHSVLSVDLVHEVNYITSSLSFCGAAVLKVLTENRIFISSSSFTLLNKHQKLTDHERKILGFLTDIMARKSISADIGSCKL